jgi:hypothetical protein
VTDALVISGAAALPAAGAAPTPLVAVPDLLNVAIANPETGAELVIHNPTGAPLRIAVEGVGDIAAPPAGSTTVPLHAEPGGPRLHLQALSTSRSQVVTVTVVIEPSDDGPIAVGQAIGGRTC